MPLLVCLHQWSYSCRCSWHGVFHSGCMRPPVRVAIWRPLWIDLKGFKICVVIVLYPKGTSQTQLSHSKHAPKGETVNVLLLSVSNWASCFRFFTAELRLGACPGILRRGCRQIWSSSRHPLFQLPQHHQHKPGKEDNGSFRLASQREEAGGCLR